MVAVIDYNAGNTRSVMNALSRLGVKAELTSDIDVIKSSDRMIFPGVGAASWAMDELKKRELIEIIKEYQRPFLGICLGMQLMNSFSEEGNVDLLNITANKVRLFDKNVGVKIPHVGWNEVTFSSDPIFKNLREKEYFYFVHSYYVEYSENTIATCFYDNVTFSAGLRKDNFYGFQFHPEKSGEVGEKLLKNFLEVSL
ncbi:imidazole glycerol phosphate synthase subunit HisH [Bullifex porci]|uniref:imidazole glycerol phosphate synthase subunit HisH n=1 Tax=Bullifex porci TaxID=2606638 RepID=UPI0023F030D8|nr:imidazole glycerol phosphate synthase subunit HisH [Bullifex porci]MDD7255267.1 imidazole glycerol phosphate synthase subunit HisH [Bullifex porci]MDY2740240.1 imidazole glycerol phosphate synthase subunit HisH [Bullifex porci]